MVAELGVTSRRLTSTVAMGWHMGVLTTLTHGSKLVYKLRPIRSHTGRKVSAAKTSFLNDLD